MNSTIEAGSKLKFTLTPMPDNVQWSVKDVDGNIAQPGVISSTGEYTAPTADALVDGFVAVMVTAAGTLNGVAVKSSALVSIMHSAIIVNPLYDSCDPGDQLLLTAKAMADDDLSWKILTPEWGSTLEMVQGKPDERHYKAGGSTDPDIPFSVDKIEIKKTANGVTTTSYIHVMIHNQPISLPLLLSEESDPSTGTVQFEVRARGVPIDPSRVIWKKLSGDGTFDDKTGVYTEPKSPAPGSFIIISATVPQTLSDVHSVGAIPLPLKKYVELIVDINTTLGDG